MFCCVVAVQYTVFPYPYSYPHCIPSRSAERKIALTYPLAMDPIYLNAFHISIPLNISDRSKLSIWNLLGLVENQAKLTEDLHNGLSCEKIEEELKRCVQKCVITRRNMYYRFSVDELKEIKLNASRIFISLEMKQRITDIIVATRQHSSVAMFSPKNSLSYLTHLVCLSALLDGKTYVLPRHMEFVLAEGFIRSTLVPVIASQLRLLYAEGRTGLRSLGVDLKVESRANVVRGVLDSFIAVV